MSDDATENAQKWMMALEKASTRSIKRYWEIHKKQHPSKGPADKMRRAQIKEEVSRALGMSILCEPRFDELSREEILDLLAELATELLEVIEAPMRCPKCGGPAGPNVSFWIAGACHIYPNDHPVREHLKDGVACIKEKCPSCAGPMFPGICPLDC